MRLFNPMRAWFNTQPAPEVSQALPAADQQALARLVPRKFELLEIWMLLFCGAYGLLVSLTLPSGSRDTALACIGMICLAGWRRFNPARDQLQWSLGAWAALGLMGWIYIIPKSGASTGPFLFLTLLFAMCYPLLMSVRSALLFTAGLLALYFVSGWSRRAGVGTELFLLRGVLIAGMCGLTCNFGRVLRQAEFNIDNLRRDTASLAYNEHGLTRYGTRLLAQCHLEALPCTLVLMPLPSNWHEAIDVSGKGSEYSASHFLQMQNRALRDMALHLTLSLPQDTIISRNARGDWVVIVPWLESETVLNRLELSFGRPVQLPFGPRKEECFVALSPCAVASRGSSDSVATMQARAHDIWLRGVRTGAIDTSY
jgi:hypothetical protein